MSAIQSHNIIDILSDLGANLVRSFFTSHNVVVSNTNFNKAWLPNIQLRVYDAEIPFAEFPKTLTLGNKGIQAVQHLAKSQELSHQPLEGKTLYMVDKLHLSTLNNGKKDHTLLTGDLASLNILPYVAKKRWLEDNNSKDKGRFATGDSQLDCAYSYVEAQPEKPQFSTADGTAKPPLPAKRAYTQLVYTAQRTDTMRENTGIGSKVNPDFFASA